MNQIGGRSDVSPLRALSKSGSGREAMAVLKAAQPARLKPGRLLLFLNKRLREIRWKRSGQAETGDRSGRVRTIRPIRGVARDRRTGVARACGLRGQPANGRKG